jgi:hypothetical protein
VPAELQIIVPQFRSVPVQPIIHEAQDEYPLFETLRGLPSVLPTIRYKGTRDLLLSLEDRVINPAEALAARLRSAAQQRPA